MDQTNYELQVNALENSVWLDLDYLFAWQNATYYNDPIHGEAWVADTPAGLQGVTTYTQWQSTQAFWQSNYQNDSWRLNNFVDTTNVCP